MKGASRWAGGRWWLGVMVALHLIYIGGALSVYPSLFPDPAYGLLVDRSEQAGAGWNRRLQPDEQDISRDVPEFNAAWSPGQHVVPATFMRFGLSLGSALTISNILVGLVAVAGWYLFLRQLGFSPQVVQGTTLLIAASRTLSLSYLSYVGGDMLAVAAFPYLAATALALKGSWRLAAAAPVLVIAGFFFKNSLPIFVAAWLGALAVAPLVFPLRLERRALVSLAAVAVATAGALALIHWGYTSRGWNAVTVGKQWSTEPTTYLLPWAMPILAGTGADMILSRIFDNPQFISFDYRHNALVLVPAIAFSLVMLHREAGRHRPRTLTVIIMFAAATSVVFTILLGGGSGGNLLFSRHYLIPGFLLLAVVIQMVSDGRWPLRAAVSLLLIVPALYGAGSFASNWMRHRSPHASHSESLRITHLTVSPAALGFMECVDRQLPGGSLVVVPVPELALEFRRARVMATNSTSKSLEEFQQSVSRGRVENLVLVVEDAGISPPETAAWRTSFVSYPADEWRSTPVAGFTFYTPAAQPIGPEWLQATCERP